jgi:hypothetical protein
MIHRSVLSACFRFRVGLFASLFVLAPAFASAQAPARNLDELRLKIKAGDTIYLTDPSGHERSGRVVDLTPTLLTASFDGVSREFQESSILKIRKRQPDPLWTGALIGGAIGLALGAAAASFSEDCSHSTGSGGCVGPALAVAGMGTAIGIGVDALIQGRKVIYDPARAGLLVSPIVAPRAVGVRLIVLTRPRR